jgi:hypothetical protein
MATGARSRLSIGATILLLLTGTMVARHRGYNIGGHVVVRCRNGHLSTTRWIPGVNLTGLDFGVARWQRCPVGRHWSLVRPVLESTLTDDERKFAHAHHDLPIP